MTSLRRLAPTLLATLLTFCAPAPQTDGQHPQARRYDVAGDVKVRIEDLDLDGTFDMRYFVEPGDTVSVSRADALLEDRVVVRERLFRTVRWALRCNGVHLARPADGSLIGGRDLKFVRDTIQLSGLSFTERDDDGACHGDLALITGHNPGDATGTHDPTADVFELSTPVEGEIGGVSRGGTATFSGTYVNRPPVARIGTRAPRLYDFTSFETGGCPPVRGQAGDPEPLLTDANTPAGLELYLQSVSYDPDGRGAPSIGNFGPRIDLAIEEWARYSDGRYEPLGRGTALGPVLFERGQLHRLLLTVFDRSGARSEAECRFFVEE